MNLCAIPSHQRGNPNPIQNFRISRVFRGLKLAFAEGFTHNVLCSMPGGRVALLGRQNMLLATVLLGRRKTVRPGWVRYHHLVLHKSENRAPDNRGQSLSRPMARHYKKHQVIRFRSCNKIPFYTYVIACSSWKSTFCCPAGAACTGGCFIQDCALAWAVWSFHRSAALLPTLFFAL